MVSDTGVDVLVEYPFDDAFAATEPKEAFIRDVLVDMMRAEICRGWEAITQIRQRQKGDDVDTLKLCGQYGYKVIVMNKLEQDDEVVSSTVIRKNISEGDLVGHSDARRTVQYDR